MVLSSIAKHACENAEGQFVYCTTNISCSNRQVFHGENNIMVVPHTSTIPLEDFYPFGGDGYLTGMNQREGMYYIESVFFGHQSKSWSRHYILFSA